MTQNKSMSDSLWGRLAESRFGFLIMGESLLQTRLMLVGLLVTLLTAVSAIVLLFVDRVLAIGVLASLLAGLATGLGALPVLWFKSIEPKTLRILLAAAAGVMLAATSFSLLNPGLAASQSVWGGAGIYVMALGILLGAFFLILTDRWLPYHHFIDQDERFDSKRKVWLFIIAVALHNFPEGWAVGVAYGAGDPANGLSLALAIGLQNIPEGLAVALPLIGLGGSSRNAIGIAALTGLIEPIGGVMGLLLAHGYPVLMPMGMAFAAGAMLFVILDDIIPAIQAEGRDRQATMAVLAGFIVMMILDTAVGG
jgi:ZIP family zinc transporter